jgi:hypothetical protein
MILLHVPLTRSKVPSRVFTTISSASGSGDASGWKNIYFKETLLILNFNFKLTLFPVSFRLTGKVSIEDALKAVAVRVIGPGEDVSA